MLKKSLVLMAALVGLMSCSKNESSAPQGINQNEKSYDQLSRLIAEKKAQDEQTEQLKAEILRLEDKLINKRIQASFASQNQEKMSVGKAFEGHTQLYQFHGKYKVLVIPVQFQDAKFTDEKFMREKLQNYLFDHNMNSISQYYRHASLGKLDLEGVVAPAITVSQNLAFYGEAVKGNSDKNARGLVVDALMQLRNVEKNKDWWLQFDNWDLSDYDKDKNFHEPDGFIDAVILVYAGKSQASCQASFDPDGSRPASADVPEGPRKKATVECFNRIWPHRWAISLPANHPEYTTKGPVVEGVQRPSMNGLKINDELFALDYNMQSEYSDRSTFIHEFGHSLTLPDVYSYGKANCTGSWEVMSQNGNLQAQEMSTFSKLSLGWVNPKVVEQGEDTSAYLGAYNFVPNIQRDDEGVYSGPDKNDRDETVISEVPEYDESVYRSIVVPTEPTRERVKVVDFPANVGDQAAYSGKFDGQSRSLKFKFAVPKEGEAKFSFDTVYHIETETNFDSDEKVVKVVTDYDIGSVIINDKVVEDLRTVSGDNNFDTLAEENALCKADRVLELRGKKIDKTLTEDEKKELDTEQAVCQKPVWVNKSYDLKAYAGQEIEVEIRLTTDAGYTELGIVVDNVSYPGTTIDFENAGEEVQDFVTLYKGQQTLKYNQMYMFEYRTPQEQYKASDRLLSYNMDNNIKTGGQSMFVDEGKTLADRFRMIEYDYQPGVLVWYYNSKFDRRTNDPASNKGKGYLLVLNSKVKEVKLPNLLSKPELFDKDGVYDEKGAAYKALEKEQREMFVCFSHTKYAEYLTGKRPVCKDGFLDYLQGLTFGGKKLLYRRERFNEVLPIDRYESVGVGQPMRSWAGFRTGLSTFRPEGSGKFAPFRIYKEVKGEMVLDQKLTSESASFEAVSSFQDKDSQFPSSERLQGDTVVVEKKGFNFRVVEPSSRIKALYTDKESGEANNNFYRRPRAKIIFSWDQQH